MSEIITHPTYNQLHEACKSIAEHIRTGAHNGKIDLIVGVARGGLIPAVILSHLLEIPMVCVDYSSKDGAGDDKNHTNCLPDFVGQKNMLVIDDVCDTGKTMGEIFSHYTRAKHYVCTAAFYYKENACHTPDFYMWKIPEDSPWIRFPFELG